MRTNNSVHFRFLRGVSGRMLRRVSSKLLGFRRFAVELAVCIKPGVLCESLIVFLHETRLENTTCRCLFYIFAQLMPQYVLLRSCLTACVSRTLLKHEAAFLSRRRLEGHLACVPCSFPALSLVCSVALNLAVSMPLFSSLLFDHHFQELLFLLPPNFSCLGR